MPVLVTATLVSLVFLGGGTQAGLLNPIALRDRIEDEIPDGDTQQKALALADELVKLARGYVATRKTGMEEYAAHTTGGTFTRESILEILAPLDEARTATLREIVRLRGAFRELLSAEEWRAIFD